MTNRTRLILMGVFALVAFAICAAMGHPLAGLTGGALVPVLGYAPWLDNDTIRMLIAWNLLDAAGGVKKRIQAKTADYAILSPATNAGDASGTIFTNRGAAGAVVFTLPAPVPSLAGVWYEFLGHADQSFTLQTATADTLIVVNDVAADSLAVSTASHKIGAHMRAVCDGISWFAYGDSVGDTFTVAT